jgi:predicted nucleic acid-binding protein
LSAIVLDASVVAAWYLRGQATAGADAMLNDAPNLEFVVPHIFPTEVVSLLLKAERNGRITALRSREVLDDLGGYSLRSWDAPTLLQVGSILSLARDEGLSAYDALYLDLAAREGLVLATRDGALIQAAARRSVPARDLRT